LVRHRLKGTRLALDREDEIVRETLVTHGGEVVHAKVRELMGLTKAELAADERR